MSSVYPNYCLYLPNFIADHAATLGMDADTLFAILQEGITFADRHAAHTKLRGHALNRDNAYYVSSLTNVPIYSFPGFQYGAVVHEYREFEGPIATLRELLEEDLGLRTNHAIITRYQDSKDGISCHSDKPATIDPRTPIAILSLGEQRPLVFYKKGEEKEAFRVPMEPGSLFLLDEKTNAEYEHAILPEPGVELGVRISITFRHITKFVPMAEVRKLASKTLAKQVAKVEGILAQFGNLLLEEPEN